MNLIGPIDDTQGSSVSVCLGQPEVVADTGSAVRLDRIIDHLQRDARRTDFYHRNFGAGSLVTGDVHRVSSLEAQQARHFDVDARACDTLLPHGLLAQSL